MFQGVQQTVPGRQTGSFHGQHHFHPEQIHYKGHKYIYAQAITHFKALQYVCSYYHWGVNHQKKIER